MLECIQNWIPEISIDITEISLFHNCLSAYARHIRDQQLMGKIAGHYKPRYSECDYRSALQYSERLAYLKELRVAAKSEGDTEIAFPFQNTEVFGGGIGASVQKSEKVKLIHESTEQYFSAVRTTVKKVSLEAVSDISTQISKNSPDLFPFRYFVVCVVGSGSLFSRMSELSYDSIANFPKQVYRAKPSREKQRLARMSFLDSLCRAMNLNEENRRKNWKLFWQYHGGYLETRKEAERWQSITENNKIDLPAITYSAQCFQHLGECLSADPSTLFCYESCSKWHLGGFLSILNRYPELDAILCKNRTPAQTHSLYLALWSEPFSNRKKIRQICRREISKMNWKAIGNVIGNLEDLESRELKALLTEYAIRLRLVEQAREHLRKIMLAGFDRIF